MILFVCDYDNTLKPHYSSLLEKGKIPSDFDQIKNSLENNVNHLNALLNQGNIVLLSTGRHYEGIIDEIKKNNIRYSYLSCNNGTELYDDTGRLLYSNGMNQTDIMFLKSLKTLLGDNAIIKIRSVLDKDEEIYVASSIKVENQDIFDSLIELLKSRLVGSSFYYEYPKIRIENVNVNKIDTIEIVKNLHSISNEDIYVMGDEYNDLEMIKKYKGYTLVWGVSAVKQRAIKCYESVAKFIEDTFYNITSNVVTKHELGDDINFKITNDDYELIINSIKKYQTIYNMKYNSLLHEENKHLTEYNFESEIEVIKKQDELIQWLITSLLKDFGFYDAKNITTFFSGSFARGTNKMSSDLDFHFAYKPDSPYDIKNEEIFIYVLSQIIKQKREKIHPMIFTAMDNKMTNYIVNNMSKNDMAISLEYDDKRKFEYQINGNIKKRMYFQLYGSKDLKRLESYLLKWSIDTFPHEWINNFKITSGMDNFDTMYHYVFNQQNNADIYLLNTKIKNFIIDLECFTKHFNRKQIVTSCDMKKCYQHEEFKRIFNFYSLLRSLAIQNGQYIKFNNLLELKDNNLILEMMQGNDIIYDTYRYFWYIKKMIKNIKLHDISYSIHSEELIPSDVGINFDEINDIVLELNKNMAKKLKCVIK